MADQERRGTKRDRDLERYARLQSKGKKKAGDASTAPSSQPVQQAPSSRPAPGHLRHGQPEARASSSQTRHPASSRAPRAREERASAREDRASAREERLSSREERAPAREERPVPSHAQPEEPRSAGAPATVPMPGPPEMDSVRRGLVGNFIQHLTPEVAGVSECSDPIVSTGGIIPRLMEALCLAFSANAASRGFSIAAEDKVKEAEAAASSARSSKRRAEKRAKDAEQKLAALDVELSEAKAARERGEAQCQEESAARRAAEEALSAAEREHARFVREELPRQLEHARRLGWEDYKKSGEYAARIAAEYRTGFLDMKAGFRVNNPNVVGVDWSFAPEDSEESEDGEAATPVIEEGEAATPMIEEGEVAEDEMDFENVIDLDEPEHPDETDQPAPHEQPDTADQPPAE